MFTPSCIGSLFKNKSSFKASQSDEILPSSTGQSDEILPSTTGKPTASRSKSLESAVIICAESGGVFVLVLGVTWHVKKKRMLNNIKRKLKVLWIHRSMEFKEFLHWNTHMNGHEADVVCSLVEITATKCGSSKSVPLSIPENSKIGLHFIYTPNKRLLRLKNFIYYCLA